MNDNYSSVINKSFNLSSHVKDFLECVRNPYLEMYYPNVPIILEFSFKLDKVLVDRVMEEVVRRHEILRTIFELKNDTILSSVLIEYPFDLEVFEVSDDLGLRGWNIDSIVKIELSERIDLSSEPLLKACIINCNGDSSTSGSVLLLVLHNLIAEPASREIIVKDFCVIYKAYSSGLSNPLVPLELQYFECVEYHTSQLTKVKEQKQKIYWEGVYNTIGNPLHLGGSNIDRAFVDKYEKSVLQFNLDVSTVVDVKNFSTSNGFTIFTVLKCAFDILLSKVDGIGSLVGIPVTTRRTTLSNDLVGPFERVFLTNHVVNPRSSVLELLGFVKNSLLDMLEYANKSPNITNSSYLKDDGLFFDAILSFEKSIEDLPELIDIGGKFKGQFYHSVRTGADLSVNMLESSRGIQLLCFFCSEKYDSKLIRSMLASFDLILSSICENTERTVAEVPFIDKETFQYLIHDINDTAVDYPETQFIHKLFEAQAQAHPERVALVYEDEQLSYGELNARANQLAHYLVQAHSVGPDVLIGLYVERSFEMVIGILAILKAGGAYVPLDPDYPSERLNYMLKDADLSVVLCAELPVGLTLPGAVILGNEAMRQLLAVQPTSNVQTQGLTSSNLAYVIYTSGSTGRPKGVMIEHRGLLNRIDWMHRTYGCEAKDRILQKTPFSFDVSVWEFMWTLSCGAGLVLAKAHGHKDPQYLASLIKSTGVTKLHFVPSMLSQMLSSNVLGGCETVRQVFCSGEALLGMHIEQFQLQCPKVELHNLYGPTEASIDVSYWDCSQYDRDSRRGVVPIGRPIQNGQLYVLSERKQLCPLGAVGELYIGGVCLARGYLHKPKLTAERFIENPFYDETQLNSPLKLYRTGDLVRYLEDGNLEYIGRVDDQVKIRGFRIELGEIESVLQNQPCVNSALVTARIVAGSQQLVAYIKTSTAEIQGPPFIGKVKQAVSEQLPDYMVPNLIVLVDEWPLTPNGKIDKKALPSPESSVLQSEYVAPKTVTEQKLTEIWAALLGIEAAEISTTINFFNLGGHSLLVNQVLQSIERLFDIELPLAKLFSAVTIDKQAELIDLYIAESKLNDELAGAVEVDVFEF
jgi:amino acid adenylation domain-containing protein